jgi:hypothetical protein
VKLKILAKIRLILELTKELVIFLKINELKIVNAMGMEYRVFKNNV